MTVSQTTRLSLTSWSDDSDPFTRTQMTVSHENLELLVAKFESGASLPTLPNAGYERALFYHTASSELYFSETGSTWVKIISNVDVATLTGTETLTNKTLTTPVIATISNGGTLTLPSSTDTLVGRATTDTLTNKTLSGSAVNDATLKSPLEQWTISAAAPSSSQNIDVATSAARYFTSNASTNFSLNFRGSSSVTLNSMLAVGESMSVAIAITNGATPYYPTSFQIDGTSVTPKWSGGSAPSAGNANSNDIYLFTIVKTAATPTYTVWGQQVQFA